MLTQQTSMQHWKATHAGGFSFGMRREQHLLCITDDSLVAVPAPPFHEVGKIPFLQLFEVWIVALEVVCKMASQQLEALPNGCVHAIPVKAKRHTRNDSCDVCCCKLVYQEPTVRRLPSCWITDHSSGLVNFVCGNCHLKPRASKQRSAHRYELILCVHILALHLEPMPGLVYEILTAKSLLS